MKRLFTLTICLLSLQILQAKTLLTASAGLIKLNAEAINADTTILPVLNQSLPLTTYGGVYKRRLDSIRKDIQLDYNEYVQAYIDLYMHNREEMGQVVGLTKYYFPIYEKAFREAGIPEEIKFLSIVESKLDPNAVSRVGATGLWQFMGTTAKIYGLNMDNYIDDRRDPIQSSYAAAAYLKDAYQEFGDWLLAIASYNCGKSNVERAVEKAGGVTDFWSIRQYLPVETRGYVPAFIAMNYVMNYFSKHNIVPQACNFSIRTDTVMVKRIVPLSSVAQALDVSLREITVLNPSYRMAVVNGSPKTPRRLILPQTAKDNYAALYNVLNGVDTPVPATAPKTNTYAAVTSYTPAKNERRIPTHHKVRKGETLASIADKFGCEVSDLKVWNHLKTNRAPIGATIKVSAGEVAANVQDDEGYSKN
ncbi:lytic transglycosylase domain-containing protein [Mucilaginibacter celer]|uniref:LysM peptidoglycan-binding domain-containing protein n=1 Tax=Mucilaginibacter celer TaxID=2305508 RepID=A0A494W1Q1_9SPHI|nr:lytic transglycosylase domain-containing protein [Mucilaginibacter celer]AYL97468.1 LysM peptidoglycan-binding domain-containing protein [Mucilaginibacter celer]